MRDNIKTLHSFLVKRIELLNALGGLTQPKVQNKEWLYLFKEETRHSIMIEGYFVSEEEMESVLYGRKDTLLTDNIVKAINYYKAANYFYSLAYESFISKEFIFGKALIRQIAKMVIGEPVEYRKGDIIIAGAKIKPPQWSLIEDWINFYVEYVNHITKHKDDLSKLLDIIAKQHILFESIHPFEDGNRRAGRIITNYLLISNGLPPVVIKGSYRDRNIYITALEKADKSLRDLIAKKTFPDKSLIELSLNDSNIDDLRELLQKSLRENLDLILSYKLETNGIQLKPSEEVARILGYSKNSIRKLIERGYFVAVKKGKSWHTHEKLDLRAHDISIKNLDFKRFSRSSFSGFDS